MIAGELIYANLVDLRNKAGQTILDRLKLADQLLKDKEWVELPTGGGGSLGLAYDRLEDDCFADLCGAVGLANLLELLHEFPREQTWVKNKFNLGKMWAELSAKRKPTKSTNGKVHTSAPARKEYIHPAEFTQLTPGKARTEYGRVYVQVESLAMKCQRLEEENAQLRKENAELRGKVDRAERIFGKGVAV